GHPNMITLRPLAFGLLALTMLGAAACSDSPAAESDTTTVEPGSIPASITAEPTPARENDASRDGDEMTTAELVERAEPSIVRIATATGVGTGFVVEEDG